MIYVKKILNIIIIFFLIISILNIFNINSCFAIDPENYKPASLSGDQDTINIANNIIGGFQAIGSIASVLALVIIGFKYMLGSVEQKADYKKSLVPYVIGAVLVFAISNISSILYNVASKW